MSFIPTCGEFLPVTERECDSLPKPNDILRIAGAEKGPPVHFGGGGIEQEGTDAPRQKGGEARECSLSILAESKCFVGLKRLQPHAKTELMRTARQRHAIFEGVQISVDAEIAPIVAAGQPELSLGVRSCAAADNDRANGPPRQESGNAGCGRARSRLSREEVTRASVAKSRGIQQCWREDVRFLEAEDLFPQGNEVRAVRVRGSRCQILSIIDGIHCGKSVSARENVVEPRGPKILTDGLQGAAEHL